jgi:hypothetical protein
MEVETPPQAIMVPTGRGTSVALAGAMIPTAPTADNIDKTPANTKFFIAIPPYK